MTITPVKEMVAQAKSEIETLSFENVQAELEAGTAFLVDIRDVRELEREGRIPGAYHAPRGMLEFWVDPESPYYKSAFSGDKKAILFCASAWRSALSTKTLQGMGYRNIAELEGGFSNWRKCGGEIDD